LAVLSKNCNYIYHMLSVSNCGYDNDYGKKYRPFHNKADLSVLNGRKNHITVSGGERCGELYGICVSLPASLDDGISLPDYFNALTNLYEDGDLEQNLKKYESIYRLAFSSSGINISIDPLKNFYDSFVSMKNEIIDITKIMSDNYAVYTDNIWDETKNELLPAVNGLNNQLSEVNYTTEWEKALNAQYKYENFYALICNSVQNGPQCIDISYDKDVFCADADYISAVKLISHEFGIYLLKDILPDTPLFENNVYYKAFESLAEYFNIIISGGHAAWNWYSEYLDFYKELKLNEPRITTKDMFLRAIRHFNIWKNNKILFLER